jgi:type IV pilus assembly protein PilB
MRRRLGDILVERGVITQEQLTQALQRQLETGVPLGKLVIDLGFARAEQMASALAEQLGLPRADWSAPINPELALLIPAEILREGRVFPMRSEGSRLTLAMVDPLDIFTIDTVRSITGMYVEPVVATADEIEAAYDRVFSLSSAAQDVVAEIEEEPVEEEPPEAAADAPADSPGVKVVNLILLQAVHDRASDVHIEPREKGLVVRFRVDGVLREEMRLPKAIHPDVTLRMKVMAGLDITERRRPQDGRMKITVEEQAIDVRISVLPTIYGEKTVLRILDKGAAILDLDESGLLPASKKALEQILGLPTGLILVTGPTGSGKTTTQYAMLNRLNTVTRNIITVEDPVEYRIDGINQVQVNPKIGVDFASNLRSVLRQDPDVVMVGEIRDKETAEIAVRAALTGHLVLSTLHTNSACGTLTRLIDMGIEPYLVSATLLGVVNQRLARRICPACKEETAPTVSEESFLDKYGYQATKLWRGRGCPQCKQSGYRGRVPIEEVLIITRSLRRVLNNDPTEIDLLQVAKEDGFRTLEENGIEKVLAGITTIPELWRTVYSLDADEELFVHE